MSASRLQILEDDLIPRSIPSLIEHRNQQSDYSP